MKRIPSIGDVVNVDGCHSRFRPVVTAIDGDRVTVRVVALGREYHYHRSKLREPRSVTKSKAKPRTDVPRYD